ncbi:RNA polymerase sigma factor [Nibrella saemangeumensis]|uniref:RNA polymerase sigma factor n=1 Tax=Nibrella saemangeumensis TaxID=1084526 RepID=A0ABP8MKU9_9BACT
MNTHPKDEDLIRAYLETSHHKCFEILYNRYAGKVYRRCLSLTKDPEQAQDFTQDVFVRVLANLERFKEKSTFSTWLYSITYNYCMDQLRRSGRTTLIPLEEYHCDSLTDTDDAWIIETNHQTLNQALETMHPEEVQVLRLKYVQGLEIDEIARQINVRNSAVKMRLKRTRDKLRKKCLAMAA